MGGEGIFALLRLRIERFRFSLNQRKAETHLIILDSVQKKLEFQPKGTAFRQAQRFNSMVMPWFVYILFCDQKTFYVGVAFDVQKRLKDHRGGYSPYTKKFSDIKLVYSEKCLNSREAKKRERQLKGWSVAKKKALISGNKDLLVKLSAGLGEVADNGK